MMCFQGKEQTSCGGYRIYRQELAHLQAGDFLRLLEGHLRLDPARGKNFFTVRSQNH